MYTQCPQCRTIFEIDEDALQASLGIVRCGHCSERFDALRTLSNTLPTEPEAALPERDPDALAPTLTSAVPPESMQVAEKPARTRASETAPAPQATPPSGNDPIGTQPGEAWFDVFSEDRARALIADAAGIPPETIEGDPAWQVIDIPIQIRFAELDAVPIAQTMAPPGTSAPALASASAEAAGSEPFTGSWGLDIPERDAGDRVQDPDEPAADTDADPAVENEDAAHADGDTDATFPPTVAAAEPDPQDAVAVVDEFPGDESTSLEANTADEDAVSAESRETLPDDASEPAASAEPIYVPPRRRSISGGDWLLMAGCAVLALALAAQVAWANRVMLIREPATQAQMLRVCGRLDCRLPPIRDTSKLELLSRDVRPDPAAAGALAITATFRNNAPFRQPWPIVVVELTDLDNNVVAMRRFRPAEYMPDAARRATGIAARSTAAVAFEVVDPGKRAVSFHFGFD
jgi:predicted Zn finger-like uncharacterized protein